MTETKIERVEGRCVAVVGNDIDTDRIIPARYLRCVTFDGLGAHVFADDRSQAQAQGQPHPFDVPERQGARVLLVNRNFGCGSSREHAPQALIRWGIAAIVGESFAEIFFGNCVANGVPCLTAMPEDVAQLMRASDDDPTCRVTVDLGALTATTGTDVNVPVTMPEGARNQLRRGTWDTLAELLTNRADLERRACSLPYFCGWAER